MEIRPAKGASPATTMTLLALMPQIVAISNCPILFKRLQQLCLKPLTWRSLKERR